MTPYGAHLERLAAVASRGRHTVIGGARGDADQSDTETLSSAVHLFDGRKRDAIASVDVEAAVTALAFTDDSHVLAGLADGRVVLLGIAEDSIQVVATRDGHAGPVIAMAELGPASDSGASVASVASDGIKTWSSSGGLDSRGSIGLGATVPTSIAWDADSDTICVGGEDGIIRAAAASLATLRDIDVGEAAVTAIGFTGDGRVIAGNAIGAVCFAYLEGDADVDARSGDNGHGGPIVVIVRSPALQDDKGQPLPMRFATVGADGTLKSWPLDTRRRPRTHELGAARLVDASWSEAPAKSDATTAGGTLAIIDDRRRVQFIDLGSGQEFADPVRIASRFDRLAEDLGARKVEVREAALRALEDLPEHRATKLIGRTLKKDGANDVRRHAADILGRTGRRRGRPTLRDALNDKDKDVRRSALAALVRLEAGQPIAALRAGLRSKHADIRKEVVARLPQERERSPLVPGLITEQLRDPDGDVRRQALDSLCELEDPSSLEPLRIALSRGPEDVRKLALRKLVVGGRVRDDAPAVEVLERALGDEHSDVRWEAYVLAVASRPTLAGRLANRDSRFRKDLAERLGDSVANALPNRDPDDADRSALFAAQSARHTDVASWGAGSLATLADSRATGLLLQLSRDPAPSVRRWVADALRVARTNMPADGRAEQRLRWLLDDTDATVRTAAFDALAKLADSDGNKGWLALATVAMGAGQDDVRVRALQILVEFGGDGKRRGDAKLAGAADALLGDALDDESAAVRNEAFKTLWAWHTGDPAGALQRGASSRHADVRKTVVAELDRLDAEWVAEGLLELISDNDAGVGTAAYKALTRSKKQPDRAEAWRRQPGPHRRALDSLNPAVRVAGARGATRCEQGDELRPRLTELLDDEAAEVRRAAIEAIDKLVPDDVNSFGVAFGSIFYDLRIRAAELCARRRDERCVEPMHRLLRLPPSDHNRPADAVRQQAAKALADCAAHSGMRVYEWMLRDEDPVVREMGARGMAGAAQPGDDRPLIDAMAHGDLPVRSWAAEGLARLGDRRAVPVLVGTLKHSHRPLREGAIVALATLGDEGERGLLQGLEDPERELQDLAFAVVVARDLALARASQDPELLLAAVASQHPEIRFASARLIECRDQPDVVAGLAQQLVGPRKPERAADMKKWPEPERRDALLNVLVGSLASDSAAQRYASTRVLTLRGQPLGFWREAERLETGPVADVAQAGAAPHTGWEDEAKQPRKKGWIRRAFSRGDGPSAVERVRNVISMVGDRIAGAAGSLGRDELLRLAFGTYSGLVRQAPPPGDADETHKIRRDALERLSALTSEPAVGRGAVVPVLRRALGDPHRLVRKAAMTALRNVYGESSLEPLALACRSSAGDVGKEALERLVAAATTGDDAARALALAAVDSPNADVRTHCLAVLPHLFDEGSVEPWVLALRSRHADLRLRVVDRLRESSDARVLEALGRALESDHDDLRMRAATALAHRGDARTVDVLAAFLRNEDGNTAKRAMEALVTLARAPESPDEASARAAMAIAGRIEDDPDHTANRSALVGGLSRIGHTAGIGVLHALVDGDDTALRSACVDALQTILREPGAPRRSKTSGVRRHQYREALARTSIERIATHAEPAMRLRAAKWCRDIDDEAVAVTLGRLARDREEEVRVAAASALGFRIAHVEGAAVDPLLALVEEGRRELVLPAAEGLARRQRVEAFIPLMLVFAAGEPDERERAVLSLGELGDRRALEELERLVDPTGELPDEDRRLVPPAAESLGAMLPSLSGEERDRVRDRAETLATEGTDSVRARAMAGLRRCGDARSRALLERVARDQLDKLSARQTAAKELGTLASPESESTLAALLDAADRHLRRIALASLDKVLGGDRTRVQLHALGSRHADLSRPAATILAREGDIETLVSRLPQVSDPTVRRRLRRGLVRRNECPVDAVRGLLAHDDAGVRAEAAWLVGSTGTAELAGAVADAVRAASAAHGKLESGDSDRARTVTEAWTAAVWAARRVGATVTMHDALASGSPAAVRRQALYYLAAHGSASDANAIEAGLSDRDPSVRRAAGMALALKAGAQSTRALDDHGADRSSLTGIVQIATAAGEPVLASALRRRATLPVLIGRDDAANLGKAAQSGDNSARAAALAGLGRLDGDVARQALEAVLANDSSDDELRAAAFRALRKQQRRAARRARLETEVRS